MGKSWMDYFKKNIKKIYGDPGEKWLKTLPNLIQQLAEKYNLNSLHPVSNMSFNYVAAGYQGAEPIILKIGMDAKALAKEAHCLQLFSNHGGVALLAHSEQVLITHQFSVDLM